MELKLQIKGTNQAKMTDSFESSTSHPLILTFSDALLEPCVILYWCLYRVKAELKGKPFFILDRIKPSTHGPNIGRHWPAQEKPSDIRPVCTAARLASIKGA